MGSLIRECVRTLAPKTWIYFENGPANAIEIELAIGPGIGLVTEIGTTVPNRIQFEADADGEQ
jgi:hypothetical protein